MKPLNKRIELIVYLGKLFRGITSIENIGFREHADELKQIIPEINKINPWFTSESIYRAIRIWGETLQKEKIESWALKYNQLLSEKQSKKVLVIMAGNIPLVGFHDFLSTILSGHQFMGKLSSRDSILFPIIVNWIKEYDKSWFEYIHLSTHLFPEIDAVIATGSNNTSRFFENKYSEYPKIIRHNRNSAAILLGEESEEDLEGLSRDILWYYGLGCRNVSLLFVPLDYSLDNLINTLETYETSLPEPYQNNLKYQFTKAVMHNIEVSDAGTVLIIDNPSLNSPLACLHIIRYTNPDEIRSFLEIHNENIQCIIGRPGIIGDVIDFGESQLPGLHDYADQIDTVEFLTKL